MARFNEKTADNYGEQGADFFSLKNHNDTAGVRFMYRNMEDVIGVTLHEVMVDGKKIKVDCLSVPGSIEGICPLCDYGVKIQAKVFIPIYDIDTFKVSIWERGKSWMGKLSGICARYASTQMELCSTPFDIVRNGAKGDQKTTYDMFPLASDEVKLADLPEPPSAFDSLVHKETAEAMHYYLEHNVFPENSIEAQSPREPSIDSQKQQNSQRRQRQTPVKRASTPAPPNQNRRTPASSPKAPSGFVSIDNNSDDDDLPF